MTRYLIIYVRYFVNDCLISYEVICCEDKEEAEKEALYRLHKTERAFENHAFKVIDLDKLETP